MAMAERLTGAFVLSLAFKGKALTLSEAPAAMASVKSAPRSKPMSVDPKFNVDVDSPIGLFSANLVDINSAHEVPLRLPLSLANCWVMVSHAGTSLMRMASSGPISACSSAAVNVAVGAKPLKGVAMPKVWMTAVAPVAVSNLSKLDTFDVFSGANA